MPKLTKEKMYTIILTDILKYEIAGHENGLLDGNISKDEFNEYTQPNELLKIANYETNNAYDIGYLISPITDLVIEGKSIRFLGNKKLDACKAKAIELARKSFKMEV